jgi:hypothetical protein
MSALHFRIDPHAFRDARSAPRRRRNSLGRIAAGILGVAVLAVLVFFSVFVGAAMLAVGLVYRLWAQRKAAPVRATRVVEGECHVVGKAG